MIPRRVRRSGREYFYHVLIAGKLRNSREIHAINLKPDGLEKRILTPYRQGDWITLNGQSVPSRDIGLIRIIRTGYALRRSDPFAHEPGYVYSRGEENVTNALITGPPGYEVENNADDAASVKTLTDAFDLLITIESIRSASRQLFIDGHYQNAVEDAFKALDQAVAHKTGIVDSGTNLMRKAFRRESPVLALTQLQTESDRGIQEGYEHMFAGSMLAIRNPRAHGFSVDHPDEAMELIVWAHHLMRKLRAATKTESDLPETSA